MSSVLTCFFKVIFLTSNHGTSEVELCVFGGYSLPPSGTAAFCPEDPRAALVKALGDDDIGAVLLSTQLPDRGPEHHRSSLRGLELPSFSRQPPPASGEVKRKKCKPLFYINFIYLNIFRNGYIKTK